jgi:adenylate cyclase
VLLLLILFGFRTRYLSGYLLFALLIQGYTFHIHHWLWPQIWPLGILSVMLSMQAIHRGIRHWKERLHLMEMFQIYVSGNVLKDLLHHRETHHLRPRSRQLAVMFVDLRGFTAFTERSNPSVVERFLNQYYTRVSDTVYRHQGTVSKFIGDGVLVVFGDPNPLPDQCCVALQCAKELLEQLVPFVVPYGLDVGIALHQGEGLVGHFGSQRRREYSVFGDVVNTASRMEALNKRFKTRLLFSKPFVHCVTQAVHLGPFPIRGKESPLDLYTLPGPLYSYQEGTDRGKTTHRADP